MTTRRYKALGLISGTSMDGIDAALLTTDGEQVLARGPWLTLPYPDDLRRDLLAVARDEIAASGPLPELEAAVTAANAATVRAFLDRFGLARHDLDLIGMHGQTVLHRPERRFTRQLGRGDGLAKAVGVDVVDGFRLADVARGGQGAPLVPLYHAALAAALPGPLGILNLGGVANVTFIDAGEILAFDTGPASALIDDWVLAHTGQRFDDGGAIAACGHVHADRLASLLDHPYFAQRPPKSLDRNAFSLDPVDGLSLEDGAATLTRFTARSAAQALHHLPAPPRRWLVTGGGRHNRTLMAMLHEELRVPVDPVEAVGWNGDSLEAECFAFLAVRSVRGLPLSLPTTTGVPEPTTGGTLHRAGG